MLPVDVVERIKSKETAQIAAREERRQKKSQAEKLSDAVRREELRQIPKVNRTAEEQRQFARLEARRYRAKESQGNVLADVPTAKQFWDANRLLVTGQKIKAWKEQEERVLDKIVWMKEGWSCPPQDADFVSLEEGLAALEHFVAEHGLVHDDPHSYKHSLLHEFRPAWGLWADKDYHDPIWGWVKGFWKKPELFRALCEENEPTAIFVLYGIRTALPAFAVRRFKERITSHVEGNGEHRAIVPFGVGDRLFVKGCWLCEFERVHGTTNR